MIVYVHFVYKCVKTYYYVWTITNTLLRLDPYCSDSGNHFNLKMYRALILGRSMRKVLETIEKVTKISQTCNLRIRTNKTIFLRPPAKIFNTSKIFLKKPVCDPAVFSHRKMYWYRVTLFIENILKFYDWLPFCYSRCINKTKNT